VPSTSENGRVSRPKFLFLGDHPAVDFANTLVPPPGPDIDFLRTWQDAIDWFVQAKLTSATSLHVPEARATEALKALAALRQAWRSVLSQIIAGGKVSDEFLEKLNALLAHLSLLAGSATRESAPGLHRGQKVCPTGAIF
jgi:predicted RNA-binding Zn ribbon-like protein